MTYKFTNEEGVTVSFPSHEVYLKAEGWYNSHTKGQIVAFCKMRGLDLAQDKSLVPGWADIAMELYAAEKMK